MKTYVIMLSQTFPATHPRKGEQTYFKEKFINRNGYLYEHQDDDLYTDEFAEQPIQRKIHTIRANYPLWRERFNQIARGEACLSVRQWSGKPYASKQREIARLTKEDGIGLQVLTLLRSTSGEILVKTDVAENVYKYIKSETIAANDGLSLEDWSNWFKSYDMSKPLAIIHFTPFRY